MAQARATPYRIASPLFYSHLLMPGPARSPESIGRLSSLGVRRGISSEQRKKARRRRRAVYSKKQMHDLPAVQARRGHASTTEKLSMGIAFGKLSTEATLRIIGRPMHVLADLTASPTNGIYVRSLAGTLLLSLPGPLVGIMMMMMMILVSQ
jgi:hypothetical protein